MDTLETIQARYSVRGYRPDPVDDETLARVLEAARQAPTAANRQPFRLLVLHTQGREEEIGRIYGRPWFVRAPLVIGVVAVPGEAWRRSDDKPYDEVDATIAMDHLVLAATSLGLGTCWVAAFDPQADARGPRAAGRCRAHRLHAAGLPGQGRGCDQPPPAVRARQVRALVSCAPPARRCPEEER